MEAEMTTSYYIRHDDRRWRRVDGGQWDTIDGGLGKTIRVSGDIPFDET